MTNVDPPERWTRRGIGPAGVACYTCGEVFYDEAKFVFHNHRSKYHPLRILHWFARKRIERHVNRLIREARKGND